MKLRSITWLFVFVLAMIPAHAMALTITTPTSWSLLMGTCPAAITGDLNVDGTTLSVEGCSLSISGYFRLQNSATVTLDGTFFNYNYYRTSADIGSTLIVNSGSSLTIYGASLSIGGGTEIYGTLTARPDSASLSLVGFSFIVEPGDYTVIDGNVDMRGGTVKFSDILYNYGILNIARYSSPYYPYTNVETSFYVNRKMYMAYSSTAKLYTGGTKMYIGDDTVRNSDKINLWSGEWIATNAGTGTSIYKNGEANWDGFYINGNSSYGGVKLNWRNVKIYDVDDRNTATGAQPVLDVRGYVDVDVDGLSILTPGGDASSYRGYRAISYLNVGDATGYAGSDHVWKNVSFDTTTNKGFEKYFYIDGSQSSITFKMEDVTINEIEIGTISNLPVYFNNNFCAVTLEAVVVDTSAYEKVTPVVFGNPADPTNTGHNNDITIRGCTFIPKGIAGTGVEITFNDTTWWGSFGLTVEGDDSGPTSFESGLANAYFTDNITLGGAYPNGQNIVNVKITDTDLSGYYGVMFTDGYWGNVEVGCGSLRQSITGEACVNFSGKTNLGWTALGLSVEDGASIYYLSVKNTRFTGSDTNGITVAGDLVSANNSSISCNCFGTSTSTLENGFELPSGISNMENFVITKNSFFINSGLDKWDAEFLSCPTAGYNLYVTNSYFSDYSFTCNTACGNISYQGALSTEQAFCETRSCN